MRYFTLFYVFFISLEDPLSVPEVEILAPEKEGHEKEIVSVTCSEYLYVIVKFIIYVGSKDLFTSLSTRRVSMDGSITKDND